MLEGIVAWAEDALPGVARGMIVCRSAIDVVVARTVVPGNAGGAEDLQIAGIEGKVVENHVAMIDAESRATTNDAGDDIVAEVAKLGGIGRLSVCHHHGLELSALVLAGEGKVDRQRQSACRGARRIRAGGGGM